MKTHFNTNELVSKSLLREVFKVFLFFMLIYFFCASGIVDTIDADPSMKTAISMWERGSLKTEEAFPNPILYSIGKDLNAYSKMGFFTPLLYLMPYVVSKKVSERTGFDENLVYKFFVSFMNPLLTAVLISIVYLYGRTVGQSILFSFTLSTVLGFGTYLFTYMKSCHREIPQALFCLIAVFCIDNLKKNNHKQTCLFIAGLAMGMGVFVKEAFLIFFIPMSLWVLIQTRKRESLFFFLPLMTILVGHIFLNHFIFGRPFGSGYHLDTLTFNENIWSTPLIKGLVLQTFSPSTGFFFINPIFLIVFPLLFYKFKKGCLTQRDIFLCVMIMVQLLLYSTWVFPTGGTNLGPRYLVVVTPLWTLFFLNLKLHLTAIKRVFLIFIFFVAILFQMAHVCIKPQQYWVLQQFGGSLENPHWLVNLKLFIHKIQNKNEVYDLRDFGGKSMSLNLEGYPTLHGYNFWWLHLIRNARLDSKG